MRSAAVLIGKSGPTIAGDLPPSSSVTGVRFFAAHARVASVFYAREWPKRPELLIEPSPLRNQLQFLRAELRFTARTAPLDSDQGLEVQHGFTVKTALLGVIFRCPHVRDDRVYPHDRVNLLAVFVNKSYRQWMLVAARV